MHRFVYHVKWRRCAKCKRILMWTRRKLSSAFDQEYKYVHIQIYVAYPEKSVFVVPRSCIAVMDRISSVASSKFWRSQRVWLQASLIFLFCLIFLFGPPLVKAQN